MSLVVLVYFTFIFGDHYTLMVKAAIKALITASCWKRKDNYSRKCLLFSVFCHVPCPKKGAGLHYVHVSYTYKYTSAPSCRVLRLCSDFFFIFFLNFSAENEHCFSAFSCYWLLFKNVPWND